MDIREKSSNGKRLIDANRAIEIVRDQGITHPSAYYLTNYATLILREAPTVDAVEVVRCRDCLYYTPVDDNTGKCAFLIGEHQYVVPDGYCYLGERKEGAN